MMLLVKNLPVNAGYKKRHGFDGEDSPGEGHASSSQYSCLKNPMDRGAWWATVHSVEKSRRRLKQLSMHVNLILLRPVLGTAVATDSALLKLEQLMS